VGAGPAAEEGIGSPIRALPGVSFWDIPPVLELYPACISPYPWYPAVSLYIYASSNFAASSHCIQLYSYVSIAVSNCICCIPLYLTVSHRLENGVWSNIHSSAGLLRDVRAVPAAVPARCLRATEGSLVRILLKPVSLRDAGFATP